MNLINGSSSMRLCILCQKKPADSAEHFAKASVHRELFRNEKTVYLKEGDLKPINIQGAKSKNLKSKRLNLCRECNNDTSHAPDVAFERLDRYLRTNWEAISDAGRIELSEIFGTNAANEWVNVLRYFAKFLACQLDRSGARIPNTLREIFFNERHLERLKLQIQFYDKPLGFSIMQNAALLVGASTVESVIAEKLIKQGLVPNIVSTKVRHNEVEYQLSLNAPETEFYDSAWSHIEDSFNLGIDALGMPKAVRSIIKSGFRVYLKCAKKRSQQK